MKIKRRFALCIEAGEYENVDLVPRKVYEVWPDPDAERHGQIRVVDEGGEDYLFPAELLSDHHATIRSLT